MGLDTTHNAWHGSYSSFHTWRLKIATAAMRIHLDKMKGFGGDQEWSCELELHPLYELINHSDCDGEIEWKHCKSISDALNEVAPKIKDDYLREKTIQFAKGAALAYSLKENIVFA